MYSNLDMFYHIVAVSSQLILLYYNRSVVLISYQAWTVPIVVSLYMQFQPTDEDEIIVYEAAINAFIKECKAELPLHSFFIKLE